MIVSTSSLVKRYGETTALAGVDLAVPPDSVYGLVGPNGAGKTTLLGVLAGLRTPTSGSVAIAVPRNQIAVLPDAPRFEPWLTAHEVVDLARVLSDHTVAGQRVDEVLGEAGLGDDAHRPVGGFSRGMLQRLGVAATVVAAPRLLILDEPSAALDPLGRREILDLVTRLRGSATVLFSSHILSDVQEVSDTVGVLREGRLLYQGPIEQLLVGSATPDYVVRLRPPIEGVVAALEAAPWVAKLQLLGHELRISPVSVDDVEAKIAGVLAASAARVVSLGPVAASLEDVFLELTS